MRATGRLVDLRAALAVAAAVPNNRNTIAILANVRLKLIPPSTIEITTTDLDCEYRATIPAEVGEGGALTVPASTLYDAARLAGGDDFSLDLDMASARFAAGKSRYELPILPVTDFPDMKTLDGWQTATLPAKDLARIFSHALPFIFRPDSGSAQDYAAGGIHITAKDGQLTATSTDRMRIARSSAPASLTAPMVGTLPEKAVTLALRLLEGAAGDVELSLTEGLMRLTCEDQVLTSRLVAGKFFDVDRAIPEGFAHVATVDVAALKASVRRTSIVGDDKKPWVRLNLEKGSLSLTGRAIYRFGEATDTIPAQYDGEPVVFGFMTRHLSEAIASLAGSTAEIHFNGPRLPVRVIDPTDPERLLLVVPIATGQSVQEAA